MEDTNYNSIYGGKEADLQEVLDRIIADLEIYRESGRAKDADPIEHLLGRVKSEESMREKCRKRGLPETSDSALKVITDAIGIRAVCPFLNDVYALRNYLAGRYELIREKDYIRHAKENGYRSLHLILRVEGFFVEVQLRTISQDTWAALEHQVRYKKNLGFDMTLLSRELKRCAEELAATDISMQTIKDMIAMEKEQNEDIVC